MAPRFARLTVLTVAAALVIVGCTSASDTPPDDAVELEPIAGGPGTTALVRASSFALGLGVESLDDAAVRRLGAYDVVVVDGGVAASEVQALHAEGPLVLGYLSVGTVEPYRRWFDEAKEQGWLLDRWPDWNEWYADTSEAGFRRLLVAEARRMIGQGFDGLFLDNVDMVSSHPDQRDGMTELVGQLDTLLGRHLLFAQNGDTTVEDIAGHLDGWNREDVTSTYDFDTDAYVVVSDEDHASAMATLRRLAARGLVVTATDYTAEGDASTTAQAIDLACAAGALPFVSDIELARIPEDPPTCV